MENLIFIICHLTMAACAIVVFKNSLNLKPKDLTAQKQSIKAELEALEVLAQEHLAIEMERHLDLSVN